MTRLPAGTVTFVFTDIEGSTRLLHELGDGYAEALAEHRRVLRDVFTRHAGVEVDTQGDAFFVAFARATDAIAAAAEGQQRLEAGPIRVRMGLHTGEPLVTNEGYVGVDVHKGARIAAAGHGGQVLMSQTTRDLLGGEGLLDLGEQRLKDLTAPERIYQLGDGEFPPLKTLHQTNLPVQPTPLIGRGRELGEVAALLQREDVRLVTLTGPGGTGKTRLALQVAADQVEQFAEGVFFVALAAVVDANLVLPIVARTLGVKETAGKSLLQALADHLREREILLVLDNLEQLDEAAPAVSEVLHSGPKLKLLVTSRAPLHVLGEREYAVPPLRLPQRQTIGEVAMLSQYESVALFVERAQAVKADFALTSENGPAVAEICVKLDGLPLAIELAAARLRILPPRTLLARLDRRLKLLTGGARDAPERQQTLRAAIDWSYSLLAEEEERLFAQLSVFVGGCTLEAAEDIFNRLREPAVDVLDGLTSLVEKNLLRESESESGEPRFSMLETIREYAAERLDELADAEEVRRAHADYFRRSCEEARPHLRGGERQAFWLDWLETEHDNVRAALTFCRRDPDAQLAIVASLEWFWYQRGYWKEAEQWLEEALGRSDRADQQRLRVLEGAYYVAYIQGKDDRARTLLDEMLALARHLRDREGIAAALHGLANLAIGEGKTEEATALEEESLSFCEGERYSLFPLTGLGFQAFFRSDYATARELFERAIAVGRAFDDQAEVTNALALLATVTAYQGQEREALALLGESVKLARELGSPVALVTRVLPGFAAVRAVRGDTEEALRIIGASTALREELGSAGGPVSTELKRRIVEAAKRDLDDDQIAAALEAGRSLTLDDALAYALEDEIAATRARDG